MKQDVSKLYFLNGTLRKNKQSDYSYLSTLKQGLDLLGVPYVNADMVTTTAPNTAGYLSKWTAGKVLGQSLIYDNGVSVGIGTTTPSATCKLDVTGNVNFTGVGTIQNYALFNTTTVPAVWGSNTWAAYFANGTKTGALMAERRFDVWAFNAGEIPQLIVRQNALNTQMNVGIAANADDFYTGTFAGDHVYKHTLLAGTRINFYNILFIPANTGNVIIGDYVDYPSSLFTVNSTLRGATPAPKMTTAQRTAIASVPEGLMVYDTDIHKLFVYDGTTWQACW